MLMRLLLLLPLVVSLAACNGEFADDPAPAPDEVEPPGPPPAVVQDTLWIEGMAEPVEMHLFEPEGVFPLQFWTYLPENWAAEEYPEEKTVVFAPRGPLRERAFISVRFYPAGMDQEDAFQRMRVRAVSDAQATGQTATLLDEPEREWALIEKVFEGLPVVGRASLTAYRGRFIEVKVRYPVEAGDGFEPRETAILESWRWADTGLPLQRPAED